LYVDPCISRAWRGFRLDFRYHSARYEISVENPHGVTRGVVSVEIDDTLLTHSSGIPLADDGTTHSIRVVLG
jgi:cyclic beta-1,2-glucan glucanotransferase